MIRRLRLRNWRAYENLDLELGPGATFVVASNGIGKTSLIMGAGWALFGDAARVDAVREIRGDADSATVSIDVRLPSGVDASITRTIDRKGKVSLAAELPDRTITSQDEVDELLAAEFGADPHVLAQLTIMIHGGAVETFQGEFDLQDHLAAVFGVTPLFEGARAAKAVADRSAKELRKAKTVQRTERRGRDELVAELEAIVENLGKANEAREAKVAAIEETSETIRVGEEWVRYRAGMAERADRLRALAEEATDLLDAAAAAEDVVDALAQREADLAASVAAAEQEAAAARGKSELVSAAVSDLQGAGAVCPTCLRPLSGHDARQAEAEHAQHLEELGAQIAAAEARAAGERVALTSVRTLLERARTLPVPLQPETEISEADVVAARTKLESQKQELQEIDKALALLATQGAQLQSALEDADEEEQRIRELEALYREEGVALAAHDALVAAGTAITERYIEPLAKEIEGRWKSMFGTGGLSLSPEGHITRTLGNRTLDFGSLSGGEKVWALLLTRLLILGASTRAPFVWLDEPLEHLDPKLRKVVAGTLAKASSGAGIRQVIVTTYEAELARQLMEDVPSASLLYVTSA
ncbi:MAG TPA: AAA family ATPase [Actinomycetota bacterium]|nr:AAA family ATPase [Actinomycetota bacterium]